MRKASLIIVMSLLTTALTAHAQGRAPRTSYGQGEPILQRIETCTQAFRNSLGATLEAGRMVRGGADVY